MKIPRKLAALLAAAFISTAAAESPRGVTLNLREASLAEVFEMLSRSEKINILLGKGVAGQVSINLYGVDIDHAVRAIADAAGFIAERREGGYVIVERKESGLDAVNGNTVLRALKVQYSNPKTVAEILAKHVSRYGKITTLGERGLIVVEDLPEFVSRIQDLLAQIDVQPRQIMIEAKILEVRLDDGEDFGVDWSKAFKVGGTSVNAGQAGFARRLAPLGFVHVVNDQLEILLSALSQKGRVHTLATPKLLALENQEASTKIGDEVGYKVTTTINQVTTESIQFLESGVILRVTPAIDQRGRILMKIHPEVSTATVNTANVPSKNTTEVTTQLVAESGQAVFIGGLMRRSATFRRTGVPLLGDLPLVGRAFSRTESEGLVSETVVIITPTIVGDDTVPAAAQERLGDAERLLLRKSLAIENAIRE